MAYIFFPSFRHSLTTKCTGAAYCLYWQKISPLNNSMLRLNASVLIAHRDLSLLLFHILYWHKFRSWLQRPVGAPNDRGRGPGGCASTSFILSSQISAKTIMWANSARSAFRTISLAISFRGLTFFSSKCHEIWMASHEFRVTIVWSSDHNRENITNLKIASERAVLLKTFHSHLLAVNLLKFLESPNLKYKIS